jgi:para-nitrobenzyl esterase
VFVYQFLWGAADDEGESVIPDPWGVRLGACHGLDIPFFFGSDNFFDFLGAMVFTEENRPGREALTDRMMAFAAQFARTGDPNSPLSSFWWVPWSNDEGLPKCLLLDAGFDEAAISMSDVELTEAGVKSTVAPEVLELLEEGSLGFLVEFLEGTGSVSVMP